MRKIALYTSVTGGYERPSDNLAPASVAGRESRHFDFLRFTDSPVTPVRIADGTQPREVQINLRVPGDPIRSARAIKILGHPDLSNHDVTVWIDNRVRLKVSPNELVEQFLPSDVDVALPLHSFHKSLSEEFDAVLGARIDDPRRVREQRSFYARDHPALLVGKLAWTAILIRRNTPAVRAFNDFWWEQVLRFSRRDQLSFPYACRMFPEVRVSMFPLDSAGSDVHEWMARSKVGRHPDGGYWSSEDLGADIGDVARYLKSRLKRVRRIE